MHHLPPAIRADTLETPGQRSAAAMLPRWARRLYRLPGVPTTDVAATAAGLAFRSGLLVVPEGLRHGPHVKQARERLGLR